MRTYTLQEFKNQGLFEEKPEAQTTNLNGGRRISSPKISESMRNLLNTVGGPSHKGDRSAQDSAVIMSMLSAGYSPSDTYETFRNSPRGRDAEQRKNSHFEDYARRTIERAAAKVSEDRPNGRIQIDFSNPRQVPEGVGLIVTMANKISVSKVQWVWPGYIPAGKLTLFAGDPGMGKSTIVADLVARISQGKPLPDGKRSISGTSLIASAEDSPADTIIPRLIAANANLKKVGIIGEVRDEHEIQGDETRYLTFPRDLALLRDKIINTGARIVVIDPLNAFVEKGTDTHKDQDIRRILHPISSMAEETDCAIIIVAHLNKKEDTSTLYRVGGSIGFTGAARSVLGVTTTPDDKKVLYPLKSSVGKAPMAMQYEIRSVTRNKSEEISWLGEEEVNSSKIKWLGVIDYNPSSKTAVPESDSIQAARDFLLQTLAPGQVQVDLVYADSRKLQIKRATLSIAKNELKIVQTRVNGNWYWSLPD